MAKKKAKPKGKPKKLTPQLISTPPVKPIFPKIVIQRVTKEEGTGLVVVHRMEKEETRYAIVFEVGENVDFKRGEVILVHPHTGHDFTWEDGEKSLSLTIIEPEDVIAKVEGTPEELEAFLDRARKEL